MESFKAVKNCVACCNKEGLMPFLEKQQTALEICEKALADFMESKRRIFPRFYFISTADLLDILANGNSPVKVANRDGVFELDLSDWLLQVMSHMSKCFQAIEKLKLDKEDPASGRPSGLGMVSCVGTEYVAWKSALALQNKVEEYMNDIVQKMRDELRLVLKESLEAYSAKPRDTWLFDWPSQIILVVSQIFWVQEVEKAFQDMQNGKKDAMKRYNDFQVQQLTRLIEVTRTELSKADRQKVLTEELPSIECRPAAVLRL